MRSHECLRVLLVGAALGAAVLLVPGEAPAGEPLKLQEIAERYADTGDLAQAKAALDKLKVKPADFLKALKHARPHLSVDFGSSKVPFEDGHGRKTDLHVRAPSESEAISSMREGGCVCVIALHGRTLDGSSHIPIARKIGPEGRTVVLGPTAQKLPKGMEPDSLSKAFLDSVPHWWLYDSTRSFPMEALRWAKRRFPIDTDRVFLSGYSMGGHGTWNIGLRFPDRFAGIAPCAGALTERDIASDPQAKALLGNARNLEPWFTHGENDETEPVANARKLDAALTDMGIHHVYEEIKGGAHLLPLFFGGGNVASLSSWAAPRKRNPAPEKIDYASIGDYADGAFWLRIAKRTGRGTIKLQGTVEKKQNVIRVSAEGPVSDLDVYLDDRLLDFKKKITIEVPGMDPVTVEKVELDNETILESWRSREDPKLVYGARVHVALKRKN
ncbi:MAG TPA: alpha/beta hydrolase-fold protein [Planctomycetota bacterium]|nr:alpha/beta hydrolase-fold protein [Planctomycetota bacterium]